MAPTKKKGKKNPVANASNGGSEPSSSGSADPAPRKRGRPRKIIVKNTNESENFKDPQQQQLLKEEIQGAIDEKNPQAPPPPPPLKRDSRRRKSEPHRAPGVLVEGI